MYREVFSGLPAANRSIQRAGSKVLSRYEWQAQSRSARRGLLAPGDAATPAHRVQGLMDYRGVVELRSVPAPLRSGEFPLGRWLDPVRGPREALRLPLSAVRHNAIVVGPPGSGKTHSIIVPWIVGGLRAGFSVVAIDVLGNLRDKVAGYINREGKPIGVGSFTLDYTRPQCSAPLEPAERIGRRKRGRKCGRRGAGTAPATRHRSVFLSC